MGGAVDLNAGEEQTAVNGVNGRRKEEGQEDLLHLLSEMDRMADRFGDGPEPAFGELPPPAEVRFGWPPEAEPPKRLSAAQAATGIRPEATMEDARRLLKRIYGYEDFRPGQTRVLETLLSGRDTVGIMPTGGGKSICYQIPALLLPGTTLVISPLISLMKDQVDALASLGIPAACLNSSMSLRETNRVLREAAEGAYKLLYIAPERLESERFEPLLRSMEVPFVAIDEAHCVSQWGHDFRTSYLHIAGLIRRFERRPLVAAFTATATDDVREDIVRLLGLHDPQVHVTGFDRPNLSFTVMRGAQREKVLLRYADMHADQAGIVYCATRKEVEHVYKTLVSHGVPAGMYHAGMRDADREEAQDRFLRDDIRVMVATNAFGMGIDKSNVRYVIHWNMPKNMEAYYQEAGRAGRDGEPGECILMFQGQDILTQKFLIEQSTSHPERKANELRRLRQMADFCHTQQCLRRYILQYFGDPDAPEACGRCGNCNDNSETEDITVEAQQIFSCIRRMRERFGMTLVAQVLKGSANKRIAQLSLDKLPTYGLMRAKTEREIFDLIQLLVADGYLTLTEGQYPVVKLLPRAAGVLKGEERVVRKTRKVTRQRQAGDDVFEELRALRKSIADRDRIPPYVVFADSTLRDMAVRLPQTPDELLEVKGVGQAKLDKYGDEFLALLRKLAAAAPSS